MNVFKSIVVILMLSVLTLFGVSFAPVTLVSLGMDSVVVCQTNFLSRAIDSAPLQRMLMSVLIATPVILILLSVLTMMGVLPVNVFFLMMSLVVVSS